MIAAHLSIAFFQFRCLDEAQKLPWSLCAGDALANLRAFSAQPRPNAPLVATKIWDMMQDKWNMKILMQMIDLLGDCPWTTAVVEQLHASAATIARFHPEYVILQLLARSLCLLGAKMVGKRSKLELEWSRSINKLDKVKRRNPFKASGRQFCFGQVSKTSDTKFAHATNLKRLEVRKLIMKKHSDSFKQKTAARKRVYDARQRASASEKMRAYTAERERLVDVALDLKKKMAEEASRRKPLTIASAQWSDSTKAKFVDTMQSDKFPPRVVNPLREASCQPGPRMTQEMLDGLNDEDYDDFRRAPQAHWVRLVALRRDYFTDSCLIFTKDGIEHVYLFMFAMMTPTVVSLCPMERVDVYVNPDDPGFSRLHYPCARFSVVDYVGNITAEKLVDVKLASLFCWATCAAALGISTSQTCDPLRWRSL